MPAARLAQAGAPLTSAQGAMILVHGRGATGDSMLSLAEDIAPAQSSLAFLAPQSAYPAGNGGYTWYPYPFMTPVQQNEPALSNALKALANLFDWLEQEYHLPPERVMLVGFSQGACLSLEYTARHPRRYGGVAGLSGGLIGPPGTTWNAPGSLDGTPVFLGCSDVDPHIPKARVLESAQVLERLGAEVVTRIYPDMGHTVNEEEIERVREMIEKII